MQKKLLVILSVLVLASLVLAACGTPATPAATGSRHPGPGCDRTAGCH